MAHFVRCTESAAAEKQAFPKAWHHPLVILTLPPILQQKHLHCPFYLKFFFKKTTIPYL
jgi:hypothetical protein